MATHKLVNFIEIDGEKYIFPKRCYVGMIIHSTTLQTEQEVIDFYGGTRWEEITGRFLLARGNGYAVGDKGGEETHTLTVNEMPKHRHDVGINNTGGFMATKVAGGIIFRGQNMQPYTDNQTGTITDRGATEYLDDTKNLLIGIKGNSQAHNNMPPYEVVYVWKCIEE